MKIGLRIWKTGLATVIVIIISYLFPKLDPLICSIAAIMSLQPSVAESVKRGWQRVQATLLGGFIGVSLGYAGLTFLDTSWMHPVLIGTGVVVAILLSNKLQLNDSAFSAISVVAVMAVPSSSLLASGSYRLLSTLVGIIVATAVNMILVPPQYRSKLLSELELINKQVLSLYKKTVTEFVQCQNFQAEYVSTAYNDLKEQIEASRQVLAFYKDELGYRRYLKDIDRSIVREVVIFEKTIKTLELILDRILDIAYTTDERINRNKSTGQINVEYGQLLKKITTMMEITTEVQGDIFHLLKSGNPEEAEHIGSELKQINKIKLDLHQLLNQWFLEHQGEKNILSLMEISIVAYDIEQTATYLQRLAKKLS